MEEIKIIFDETSNQSLALYEDKAIGECQFEIKDDKWYIMHTGVRPEFGGRGIARMLVEKVLEEASQRKIVVVPICSYAQKVMNK